MIPSQTPLPKIPLGSWVETLINWIQTHLHGFLGLISQSGTSVNDALVDVLLAIPPLVMVVVFVLIAWLAKSWRLAVGTAVTFLLIISMGQWVNAMETLVLVTLATVTALIFAIPLGIWAARNKYVSALVRPVLDLMQTMPAFVYLIPSVLFFSIGVVPGMFATLIRNGGRYVLLNADGAASPRSWAEGTVPGICENSVRAKKALDWIGEMSRDGACAASLCSHDPDVTPQTIEL